MDRGGGRYFGPQSNYPDHWRDRWSPTPQSFAGEDLFPSDIEKIARLGYGLAANHAFIDGNKRIGAMLTQLLLKWNGYHLELQKGELADMFIAIAGGSAGGQDLLVWIRAHIR